MDNVEHCVGVFCMKLCEIECIHPTSTASGNQHCKLMPPCRKEYAQETSTRWIDNLFWHWSLWLQFCIYDRTFCLGVIFVLLQLHTSFGQIENSQKLFLSRNNEVAEWHNISVVNLFFSLRTISPIPLGRLSFTSLQVSWSPKVVYSQGVASLT